MHRLILWLKDSSNRLWVKPALGSILALVFALLAALGNRFIPEGSLPVIERATLDSLLSVIASSMLAVTTFSLSIMVAAFSSASSGASPRATELLVGDEGSQTAIASFISAFIYSIVAQTALGLGYYGPTGRFILFVSTLAVLVYLVVTLIKWVHTLASLGRMGNTIEKVERASLAAMRHHRRRPSLGAVLASPAGARFAPPGQVVAADTVGYVRSIDMAALQQLAEKHALPLHILVRPGAHVMPGTPLAWFAADHAAGDAVRHAIVLNRARSFDQDPRFGLIVLSEVAQRALSPAVNDPGTAIAVMHALARVLVSCADANLEAEVGPQYDRLSIVGLDSDDFIVQSFDPIARDGAGVLEVQVRMQKILAGLGAQTSTPGAGAAGPQARKALARAMAGLTLQQDKDELLAIHDQLYPVAASAA